MLRSRFEAVLKRSEKVKLHTGIKDKVVVVTGASSESIRERAVEQAKRLAVMLAERGAKVYSARAAFRGEWISTASTLCGRILSFGSG